MNRSLIAVSIAALLAAAVAGCATPAPVHYALTPLKANGQDLPGLDEQTTLESRQPGGIVSIRASQDFADYGAGFVVAVQNKSAGPLDFGPQSVEATSGGKKLAVLGAEELDAKVKAKLAGYIRATNRTGTTDIDQATTTAQRQYQYETYGGNAAGSGGGSSCVLSSSDNCRGYRVDRENREADAKTVAEVATTLQQSEQLIAKRALRPAMVAPEQMAGGVVVVEPPKQGGPVDLTVTFNGQKHHFTFNAKPTA